LYVCFLCFYVFIITIAVSYDEIKYIYHFYRAMLCVSADYALATCPSVCLSVRLSHASILSKGLNIIIRLFHRPVTTTHHSSFSRTKYRPRTPNAGASNAGDMKKSRFSTNISFYIGIYRTGPPLLYTILFASRKMAQYRAILTMTIE